jgi:mRNA-degrading endonuclease toxin of MazEF toxin-antitoxin module
MTNTLSLPRTGKFAVLLSAVLTTAVTFSVATSTTPANAAGNAYYSATLAAPAGETRAVAGGVAWSCEGSTCVANKAAARPLRICRGLNRKFGEVATFKVDGQELTAEELAKCNA